MPTDLLAGAGSAAGAVGSALGNTLDVQRWGLGKLLTGQSDTDKQREVYRSRIGLKDIYPSLPHPVRGLIDFGLDTATDPLTYETLGAGAIRGGAVKAGTALTGFAKSAAEKAPSAMQPFLDTLGGAIQHGKDEWVRQTTPGGKAVGELALKRGRPAQDLLLGATSKHNAQEEELAKRFVARYQATVKGLSPEEETNVYKVLHGEGEAASLSPKEQTAYTGLRKASDEAAYLEGDKGLRTRISMRQGGLGKRAPAPGEDLFRYQNAPGEAQFSPGTTSTFYSMGKPGTTAPYKKSGLFPVTGGSHVVTDKYAPKNPLELPAKSGSVGAALLEKFFGPERAALLTQSANRVARGEHLPEEPIDQLAVELGIHPAGRPAGAYAKNTEMSAWEQSLAHETGATAPAMLDRLGAEAARQRGHDAVIMRRGETGSTDQFMRLYPPGKSPTEIGRTIKPKPAPAPPANELDAFLNDFAEPKPGPKPGPMPVLDPKTWRRAPVKPMELSPDIKEFVGPAGSRPMSTYRKQYLPGPRADTEAEMRESFEYNPLNYENPNLKPQGPFTVDQQSLPQFKQAWERMFKNASRETSRNALGTELAAKGLDPSDTLLQDALQERVRAKGPGRTTGEKAEDLYKGVTRYGRAGQVGVTPFHAGNIGLMQLTHAPTTIPESISTAVKALAQPSKRYDLLREGRELGAVGPSEARKGFFQDWPLPLRLGLGAAAGAGEGWGGADDNATHGERLVRAGEGAALGMGAGALLPEWSKAMSKGVFTYDDAAKQALAKNYAAKGVGGGRPYGAGRQAVEDLIDYGNRSELGNKMAWGSKFPTYYSQLPGAVLRGVSKNPARFEAINRATGGLLSGGTAQPPFGSPPIRSEASAAKIGRDIGHPIDYVRSSLSAPQRTALSAFLATAGKDPHAKAALRYFTYGKDPLTIKGAASALAQEVPEGTSILQDMGLGQFAKKPGSDLLRDLFFSLTTTTPR